MSISPVAAMLIHDLALYAAAAAFAVMGVGALVSPDVVTAQFGSPRLTVAGRNEVRAVYGGFGLAMAGMLTVAAVAPDVRAGIGLAIALALIGMAVGRLISAAIDRALPARAVLYLVIEVAAAAVIGFGAFPG